MIVFIGREGGYTYFPETRTFCGVVNFADAHLVHFGLISNFDIGMRPKVVHPHRVGGGRLLASQLECSYRRP